MANDKKRPSKKAKAAAKALAGSKLLAVKAASEDHSGTEFTSSAVTPRTSTAIKPRPNKKRG
jgi:hypothetical protein